MAATKIRTSRCFDKIAQAWAKAPRYLSCRGGTRSGKTFSLLQLFILVAAYDRRPTINSVVSETYPHLRRGAIRDFKTILGEFFNPKQWSETTSTYTFGNGAMIEFFSSDTPGKVHGPSRDRLFINEAQNIPFETARQLFVRTRGTIVLDYNPTSPFWLTEDVERRPDCITVHSTYLDNDFLSPAQVAEIEKGRTDANWWKVYGEGRIGTLEGVIYDFDTVDELPPAGGNIHIYGLDFGFTNDPTAIVEIVVKGKDAYIDELCYSTGMLNKDIALSLDAGGVQRRACPIYCDCAEPKSITDIARYGYNVKPCTKGGGQKSIMFQIQFVKSFRLHVTKRSLNLIKELRNYVWETDKDGARLNVPTDRYNHAMDAMRYALYTHLCKAGTGQYTIRM